LVRKDDGHSRGGSEQSVKGSGGVGEAGVTAAESVA